jgi:asparagine synthase (glutamine-hydrolysing)
VPLHPLSALEVASGFVTDARPRSVAPTDPLGPPVVVLEAILRPALERAPCLVSFSGGLDSSVVLAVADRLARREGLARPVPATFRFTDAPDAFEDAAQEAAVAALGCPDWLRITLDDEADMVGPIAARALLRHGLLYPANAYLHLPLLERAGVGTVVTGFGGDQVFGGWRRAPRKRKPWWWRGRGPIGGRPAPQFGWLRPAASWRVRHQIARERAAQPTRFDDRVRWHVARRDVLLSVQTLDRLASGTDAQVLSPLVDRRFAVALSAAGGPDGFAPAGIRGRPALLASVFADLPVEVTRARPKATFRQVFWRDGARQHMRSWDGAGIDTSVVDVHGLREEWQLDEPAEMTAHLIQQTWLAQKEPARNDQEVP